MTSRYKSAIRKSFLSFMIGLFLPVGVLSHHNLVVAEPIPERLVFKAALLEWVQSRSQYSAKSVLVRSKTKERLYHLYGSLLLNDVVSDHIYELVGGKAEHVGEELVESVVISGLDFISESDSERYLQILKGYLASADFGECQHLAENNFFLSPMYIGGFDEVAFHTYSDLVRKAVFAEVVRGGNDHTTTSLLEGEYPALRFNNAEVYSPANDYCRTTQLLVDRSIEDGQGNKVRTLRGYARELYKNL